ncbi:MAG: DUF4097 family beta strand repeat-containing protein [Acidobacteriota bacterium]|nr:DUF4097 family beta strand repeat-containing protein [Acidobacteriota bacterium]
MRNRSLAGPILLIGIGALFLLNNLHPEFSVWDAIGRWWPFLLIGFGVLRLLEVLLDAGRGRDVRERGLPAGQVVLLILVCIAVYTFTRRDRVIHIRNFQGSGMELFGEQFDYPVTLKGQAAGVTMLVLDNLRGNVTVTGGDGQEYAAEGHKSIKAFNKSEADQTDRKTQVRFVREGNQLILRADEKMPVNSERLSTDLEIRVPRGVSLEARGRSGDLTVSSIQGMVDVASDRGDVRMNGIGGNARIHVAHSGLVRVADAKGTVDIDGRGSDVQLENLGGAVSVNGSYSGTLEFKNLAQPLHFQSDRTELRIGQVAGTFTMDLGDIRASHLVGPVKLRTRSRDVHIEDFSEAMDLEVERGDIELTPVKLPLSKIDVRSRNGNVELTLPERAEFDLKAITRQGEAHNEYGTALTADVDGRAASLKSVSGKGPAITITTERGTILVKKS